jgi:hypothetical protein
VGPYVSATKSRGGGGGEGVCPVVLLDDDGTLTALNGRGDKLGQVRVKADWGAGG